MTQTHTLKHFERWHCKRTMSYNQNGCRHIQATCFLARVHVNGHSVGGDADYSHTHNECVELCCVLRRLRVA